MGKSRSVIRRTIPSEAPPSPIEPEVAAPSKPIQRPQPPVQPEPSTPTGLAALLDLAQSDAFDMRALLDGNAKDAALPSPGDRVSGTILRVGDPDSVVDLGRRAEAWIATRELNNPKAGDAIDAWVVASDDMGVRITTVLSGPATASLLVDAQEAQIPVEGRVDARQGNSGYVVRIGNVRAFMPTSHASRLPLQDPDSIIGSTLQVLVREAGDRTIVSRRELEERELEAQHDTLRASLHVGERYDAVVLNVQGWGAYLDIAGIEARLPRREASWDDVPDLTTLIERGQRIAVRIIDIDAEGRIIVSMRDEAFDPWAKATQELAVGTVLRGKIVNKTDFGLFVRVATGIDGLLHQSRVHGHPAVGQEIDVQIRAIDPTQRRVDLGLPGDEAPVDSEADDVRAALRSQNMGSFGTLGDLLRAKLAERDK